MSMTREEAIAVLAESKRQNEVMRDNPSTFWASHQMADGVKNAERRIAALDMALSALRPVSREQVEKVWRGEWEWYDEEVGSPLEGIEREWGWRCSKCKTVLPDEFDNPDDSPAMRFCQWCGAPMTDEAVQMVMERMETMYGEEN